MVLGAVLCVFMLVNITVLANTVQTDVHPPGMGEDNTDPKELLFQTITDIAKNEDVQKLAEKYEVGIHGEKSPSLLTQLLFSVLFTCLSADFLNYAYNVGLKISDSLDASALESMVDRIDARYAGMFDEISAVIENNEELSTKVGQLSDLNCGCHTDNPEFAGWHFPIICTLLYPIAAFAFVLFMTTKLDIALQFLNFILYIGDIFNCRRW